MPGAVVLGHDGLLYGVTRVEASGEVELYRYGQTLIATPPPGTPITVIEQVTEELRAADVLIAGGLGPLEIIGET